MAADCIFCKIVKGEIPSQKVHDDAHTFAFLDIKPLAKGHTLVIPKVHYARLEDMPAGAAATLMKAVHTLAPLASRAVGAPATTIAINNGKEAGQEVAHVHVHIVPRTAADGHGPIHALFRTRPNVGADELAKIAEKMRGRTAVAR